MAENLLTDELEKESLSIGSVRSRLKELSALVDGFLSSSDDSIPQPRRLLEDFNCNLLELSEDPDVDALSPDDLEAYIEQLKKELCSTEEESLKFSREIETLETRVSTDSSKLDGDLQALSTLLDLADSKGLFSIQSSFPTQRPFLEGVLKNQTHAFEEYKFKLLEYSQQIEINKIKLTTLEGLHDNLKRLDTISSFEDIFCGVKCIQYEDNCIRLSLRTPIPSLDSLSFKRKMDCSMETTSLNHELLIELTEKMGLKDIEIFPGDVNVGGIINTLNSSRFLPIITMEDNLGWFIRQIQQRIILCTLRRLLVKDASSSRCSVIYSDLDEMFTAHVEGDLEAFVKVSHGWPLSNYPLMLWSLKHSDRYSKSISWSLLCKIQEQANTLDMDTRHDLKHFIDFILQLVMDAQVENSNSSTSS